MSNDVRGEIERGCDVFLGWTIPANSKPEGMHFVPTKVADFLLARVPGLSIGAASNYIWSMAFAPTRAVMAMAFRNLFGLLPADFGGEDFSAE